MKSSSRNGYGLAILLVFVSSSLLLSTSLQLIIAPTVSAYIGSSSNNNFLAQQIANVGLIAAQDDVHSKLNLGQTVDTTYRLPTSGVTNVSVPIDPTNTGGGNTVLGNYYVTITSARASTFQFQVTSVVGNTTYTTSKILSMTDTPAPNYTPPLSCAAVLASIQAGTISSISDSDLKNYATNACYVQSGSTTNLSLTTASNGSQCQSTTCTYSGSGTAILDRIESATVNFNGTYSVIDLASDRIRSGCTFNSTTTGARTINIAHNDLENAFTVSAAGSSGAHTFIMPSIDQATSVTFTGGSGNDIFSVGTSLISASGGGGNDTFILPGTVSSGKTIDTGAGNDTVYTQTIQGTVTAASSSSANIYFSAISGSGAITGSPGNDIIACNVGFNGVTPACSSIASGLVSAGAGNDILYLNANIGANFTINGNSGNDVIYVGGLSASTDTLSSGSGNSLVIINGSVASSATVTGGGTGSVLLIKTGSSIAGATISGFARTLYY